MRDITDTTLNNAIFRLANGPLLTAIFRGTISFYTIFKHIRIRLNRLSFVETYL